MVVVVAHCRQSMNNVLVTGPPPPPVMTHLVDQGEFVIVEQSSDSHMQLQRHLSKHGNDYGDGDDNDEEGDGGARGDGREDDGGDGY